MNAITLLNPYQKMGTDIPDGMNTAQALAHVGLAGWNQRLLTPLVMDGGTEYPAGIHRALVADLPTGPAILGTVTKDYRAIQNEEAFTPLIDTYGEAGLKPVVAGAYRNGARVFVTFEVPEGTVDINGDPVKAYVLATKGNDGTGGITITSTMVRAACGNQITGIHRRDKRLLFVKHRGMKTDVYAVQQAEVLLGLVHDWQTAMLEPLQQLAAVTVTAKQYRQDFVPAVLGPRPPDDKKTSQTVYDKKTVGLFAAWESEFAAHGDTGWHAYNAVTEWEQHYRSNNQRALALAVVDRDASPYADAALATLLGDLVTA